VLWIALGLRLIGITQQSIWYDEGLSIFSARGSVRDILRASAASEHPPLHALLLALWMRATGDSEFAVRYLSTWWGVLAVALALRLGRQLVGHLGRRSAALSALLLAFSPLAIWYSQETRGYTMALALVTAAVAVGETHLSPRTGIDNAHRLWVGTLAYVLLAAAALYTHLYSAFVLLALNLALAIRHLRQRGSPPSHSHLHRRGPVLFWIGAQLVVLALLIPWLPTIAAQWQLNATYFHGAVDWKQIVRRTLLALSVGETLQGLWAVGAAGAYLLLSFLGTLALTRYSQASRSLALLWLWMLVPLSFQFTLNRRLPKFSPRYMLNLLPPFLLLASIGMDQLFQQIGIRGTEPGKPRRSAQSITSIATIAALLAATALIGGATARSLANHYLDPGLYRPDIRAVAHYIEAHATPDDVIVLLAGHNAPAFTYYYQGDLPIVALPDELLPDTRAPIDVRALETVDTAIQGRARLWLVLWQAALADPTGLITDELEHTYPRLGVGRTFHDVALLLFDVRSGPRLAHADMPRTLLQADFRSETAPDRTQVRLLGYDLDRQTARAGDTLYLHLYWQAAGEIEHDYRVFTQLLGAENDIVAQHDKIAGADAYPTSHWPVGVIVRDRFLLTLGADTPPGRYTLIAGLYKPGRDLTRLRVQASNQDHVVLTQITVE
jgi:hypothetical protein